MSLLDGASSSWMRLLVEPHGGACPEGKVGRAQWVSYGIYFHQWKLESASSTFGHKEPLYDSLLFLVEEADSNFHLYKSK
jgi:hypothetical protein